MAQLIFRDSGMLVDIGDQFADFDPEFHQIVDTGQTFHEFRVPKRQMWFYCPAKDWFYLSTRQKHGLVDAIKSQFETDRSEEIEDILEEHGIEDLLNRLDIIKLRRKLQKARGLGQITVEEGQKILAIFDHLEVTA